MTVDEGGDAEPTGYAELLETLKERVRTTQLRAARSANTEVLRLYWSIGRDILGRQEDAGWGAKVIDRLAADLRSAFPDQRGWSRFNLHYMRTMAQAWLDVEVVPRAVGQLPCGHVRVLLDRLEDTRSRSFCATGRRARLVPRRPGTPDHQRPSSSNRRGAVQLH